MITTKCEKCIFAKPGTNNSRSECSQGIINKIQNVKSITVENNYNIIEEYACRYGFAREIYEKNIDHLKDIDMLEQIKQNAKCKYYLLLDINEASKIDDIIDYINNMEYAPTFVSLVYRDMEERFQEEHKTKLVNNASFVWKAHNFIQSIDLHEGIDHILSTNMQNSKSSHFLVYNSSDIDNLSNDIKEINDILVLYQKPHIAMIKNNTNFSTLYGLFISFENYKVAKSIGDNLLEVLKNESEIIHF